MAASTKILTVSYGTFSCTAEGFEDPLDAVRDTTQFFRGVVREDRFFGAEPPKYDPELAGEMLRRQISAEFDGDRLALRPGSAPDAAQDPTPGTADAQDPAPTADAVDGGDAPSSAPADTQAEAAPPDAWQLAAPRPAAGFAAAASIADKLARIRAVVADDPGPAIPVAAADQDTIAPSDERLTWQDSAETQPKPASTTPDDAPFHGENGPGYAPQDSMSDATDTAAPDAVASEPQARDAMGDATEAFDTDAPLSTATTEDMAEDERAAEEAATAFVQEPAPLDPAAMDPALDMGLQDTFAKGTPYADTDADTWPEAEETAQDHDTVAAMDTVEEAGAQETDDIETVDPQAAPALPEAEDDPFGPLMAQVQATDTGPAEAAPADEDVTDHEEAPEADTEAQNAPATQRRLAPPPGGPAAPRRRTRVVSVKRTRVAEPAESLGPRSDKLMAESSLDPEEEAALSAELAAIRDGASQSAAAEKPAPLRLDNPIFDPAPEEDDRVADTAAEDDSAVEGVRKAVKLSNPARSMLTDSAVDDADESRLLAQTDSEMEEPESSRRRSAIAHLRAAVAAKRADYSLGRRESDQEAEPYREDLASVVRPRRPRPQATSARAARRAAPAQEQSLQVVSETERPAAPAQPVQPRRVAPVDGADGPAGDTAAGFAQYAEEMGARSLPELLEAAAAYLAYVERREQFSRPQLMSVVQRADGGRATREDRLRSFGRLLRDGKIEKTLGGRFAATPAIGFRPDARVAG